MAWAPRGSGTHLIPLERSSVPAAGRADTPLLVLVQSHGVLVHTAMATYVPSPAVTTRGVELAESHGSVAKMDALSPVMRQKPHGRASQVTGEDNGRGTYQSH